MAEKAVFVTAANVADLNKRFQKDATGVPAAIGYYLVAGFGEDGDYDMLSSAVFNQKYTVGKSLRNGFFEAVRK